MNPQQISQIQSLEELLAWMLSQTKWPIKDPTIRKELIQAKQCFHRAICKQLEK
ncbi:hypothetical protein IQ231_16940 [Cuspidothrix issatschenkoi LEGE 03284]|uniref:hypothetical protein n=1 Tax=Cuspidothrix issatschenkoi TaxID=230752 RepID=UPI00187EC4C5|nr:hypothetical protein [Cuspidothrix issatschenkoi]MBE9233310.1 hypothetical protein [Cuspidothrix issatschenkoi LEGE 03284]